MPVYRFDDMVIDPTRYPWGYGPQQYGVMLHRSSSYIEMDSPIVPATDDFNLGIRAIISFASGSVRHIPFSQRGDSSSVAFILYTPGADEVTILYQNASLSFNVDGGYDPYLNGLTDYNLIRTGSILKLLVNGIEDISISVGAESLCASSCRVGESFDWFEDQERGFVGTVLNMSISVGGVMTGRWDMNEGAGTTIYDSVGSNNGTINIGKWRKI